MTELNDCKKLTIMMRVADVARADIALTPDRIYYRFATDDSIEDGELPPVKEDFSALVSRLVSAASSKDGESKLGQDVRLTIFTDNRVSDLETSEQSLRRLVGELRAVADEFAFLSGFC